MVRSQRPFELGTRSICVRAQSTLRDIYNIDFVPVETTCRLRHLLSTHGSHWTFWGDLTLHTIADVPPPNWVGIEVRPISSLFSNIDARPERADHPKSRHTLDTYPGHTPLLSCPPPRAHCGTRTHSPAPPEPGLASNHPDLAPRARALLLLTLKLKPGPTPTLTHGNRYHPTRTPTSSTIRALLVSPSAPPWTPRVVLNANKCYSAHSANRVHHASTLTIRNGGHHHET